MARRLSFKTACSQYVHRFTMEHVPDWATHPCGNGRYYAPQYTSDREWYANTKFPGEPEHFGDTDSCYSTGLTWPLGQWLDRPFGQHQEAATVNLSDLVAAVQCRRDPNTNTCGLGWETIAAFNSLQVAEQYTRDCQDENHQLQYRTIHIKGNVT
jgi:hypothetical protein